MHVLEQHMLWTLDNHMPTMTLVLLCKILYLQNLFNMNILVYAQNLYYMLDKNEETQLIVYEG